MRRRMLRTTRAWEASFDGYLKETGNAGLLIWGTGIARDRCQGLET
jgi:uncharacterized protein YbcV (DUF1398 family)